VQNFMLYLSRILKVKHRGVTDLLFYPAGSFLELEKYKRNIFQHVLQCLKTVFNRIGNELIFFDESKQQSQIERINIEKCQLSDKLRELESIAQVYEKILSSGQGVTIVKYLLRSIGRTPQNKNIKALNYLKDRGYDNIELLQRNITKLRIELQKIENEKILVDSRNERTEFNIEREKDHQSYEFDDRSQVATANNALIYLRHCGKISDHDIQIIGNDINEILRNDLDRYDLSIKKKMKKTFDSNIPIENYLQKDLFTN
jgi:hypothetical protein